MCWASTTNRNHPHNQKIFLIHYKKSRSAVKKVKDKMVNLKKCYPV